MKLLLLPVFALTIAAAIALAQQTSSDGSPPPTATPATTTTTTTNSTPYNGTKEPKPSLAIPEEFAAPMLWAAGPVSIMAMLFGGSPVNGLYSTSALAVVEFSLCYRDFVDGDLRFPEAAVPGWMVGREEGQHVRGALVSNMVVQISLVIILFGIGVVVACLSTAVRKRRNTKRQAKRGLNNALIQASMLDDEEEEKEQTLFERVSIAVWYPGSYILVSSIFLEGTVASVVRLFVIGADIVDVILAIIGILVVTQIQYRAWEAVSKCFHGAGPVRFCSCYVRVPKKYHESAITQVLRSKSASTFLLGNYLWCAKKGTEDSKNNVLPGPARPAGLLVIPFRARNSDESGIIALATRYFFVESCFAMSLAICRGVLEPCAVNIWIISVIMFFSTLLLIRVRPFNIPFYNTTAVWTNGSVTVSALCIATYWSGWTGNDARLAGEVIAMTAALGGSAPFVLYLVRAAMMWSVSAELCPIGLLDESSTEDTSLGGGGGGNDKSKQKAALEDDLEMEAILSSAKQPVNWPLRKATDLQLKPLQREIFVDDANLFARRADNRNERASIFSAEGHAERERLRSRRPRAPTASLLDDDDDVIQAIPAADGSPLTPSFGGPQHNSSGRSNGLASPMGGSSPRGGNFGNTLQVSSSLTASSLFPHAPVGSQLSAAQQQLQLLRQSSLPRNLPSYGASPLMESYVI